MEQKRRRYPIGIQTFSEIREEGYVYVDKTEVMYELTHDLKFVFLSRPRRFGKSLLTSTLRSYFEGRRELFEGLALGALEKEWVKYPVLHFDMSGGKFTEPEELNVYLDDLLKHEERHYGITSENQTHSVRLKNLIRAAYEQTGQKVVVLIDEYDAPLLDVLTDEERLPKLRNIMRNFYSVLKGADLYLRFVFLTGITKFSQLSIFSELNNIANISLNDRYAAICGITEEEMLEQMSEDIDCLAEKRKVSRQEMVAMLKRKYDGYHFSPESPDIYNPFSLLNCFHSGKLDSFWFGSGTPTFLIEQLRRFGMVPSELGGKIGTLAEEFDTPTNTLTSIVPLLYQSGYITIKSYDQWEESYTLAIPNTEVRIGLMRSLLPNYVRGIGTNVTINKMAVTIGNGDVDGAFRLLQTFFSTVPYCNDIDHEGHWQQMLYVVLSLFGGWGDVEVHTATGRVDLAMIMWGKLYLFEVKLDGSAQEALEQIDVKQYDQRFALCGLPVVKVGVNFSTKTRTIEGWLIEQDN